MPRKRFALLAAIILLATLISGAAWLRLRPSIRPDEVQLDAALYPPGEGQNLLPYGNEVWMLEITLAKSTPNPLWREAWSFVVTPIVDGLTTPVWDHLQGPTDGPGSPPAGGEGFVILRDARVRPQLARLLEREGLSYTAQEWDQVYGFRYAGEAYPVKIRYYLNGGFPDNPAEIAVTYSHLERRWGREVGWSKLVRARVSGR